MEFTARDPDFARRVRASFGAQPFMAEARVVRPGRTITVVRADVLAHEDGRAQPRLIAVMLGTMILRQ